MTHQPSPRRHPIVPATGHTLADAIAGYLDADHTIRRVSVAHRAATAALLLKRIHFDPAANYDRGYRSRLREFATAPTTDGR